jgi:hypothetical protein
MKAILGKKETVLKTNIITCGGKTCEKKLFKGPLRPEEAKNCPGSCLNLNCVFDNGETNRKKFCADMKIIFDREIKRGKMKLDEAVCESCIFHPEYYRNKVCI